MRWFLVAEDMAAVENLYLPAISPWSTAAKEKLLEPPKIARTLLLATYGAHQAKTT